MNGFVREHGGAVAFSVVLHLAIAAALLIGLPFAPSRPVSDVGREPIEAVLIDQAALEREVARVEQAAIEEQRRIEEEARQAAEAAERERQRQEAERLERERAEQQARDEALRLEREREREAAELAAREEAERRAREEAERQAREEAERRAREEAERRAREEAERRAREEAERLAREAAERQRALEEELQRELAAEDERRRLQNSAEMDAYQRALELALSNNWIQPAVMPSDLSCRVQIRQSVLGTVEAVTFLDCNGDQAVRQSIDRAARRASPLPAPSDRRLFTRTFIVRFTRDF